MTASLESAAADLAITHIGLVRLVAEWRAARRAFLDLPPNDPGAIPALNRLANAEDALMKGTT